MPSRGSICLFTRSDLLYNFMQFTISKMYIGQSARQWYFWHMPSRTINVNTQLSSGATVLVFCLNLALLPYFMHVTSECSEYIQQVNGLVLASGGCP